MPAPLHTAQQGSLCIHLDLECLIIPHSNRRHYRFITANNELSAFVLQSKDDV